MRAQPYREKRRKRHDRRVAARRKQKVRQESSRALVPVTEAKSVFPLAVPVQKVTAPTPTIHIYSAADLRRLDLMMRKRARQSGLPLFQEVWRKAA
jgi:hypothetical protein